MDTNKISTKLTMEFKEATDYLEALLESFKAGKIVVEKDGEFVTMVPAEQVKVEISAKSKKGKSKFSMELSWEETKGGKLTITDKEPETDGAVADKVNEVGKETMKEVAEHASDAPKAAAPAAKPAAPKAPTKKAAAKKVPLKKAPAKKAPAKPAAGSK